MHSSAVRGGPEEEKAAWWVRVAHCSNQGSFGAPLGAPQSPGGVLKESIKLRYKKRKANVTKKLKLSRKRKRTPPEKLEVRKAKSERRPKVS